MDYQSQKRKNLLIIAKGRGIKYLNILTKKALCEMLELNDKDPTHLVSDAAKARQFEIHAEWRAKNPDRYRELRRGIERRYWAKRRDASK